MSPREALFLAAMFTTILGQQQRYMGQTKKLIQVEK